MATIPFELDFKYHNISGVKMATYFEPEELEQARQEWTEHYKNYADKIIAEGGSIRAYVVENGFRVEPRLEVSDTLKEEIRAAGMLK